MDTFVVDYTLGVTLTRAEEAFALASALEVGAVTVAETQEWADRYIQSEKFAPETLLELSLCNSVSDGITLLHSISSDCSPRSASLLFGYLLRALRMKRISHITAAGAIERLAHSGCYPVPEAENKMYCFADEIVCSKLKIYGDPTEIQGELEEFLATYAT